MSPIVATLLMVAITVVVAVVMLIIVRDIDAGDEPAPIVQFVRNNIDGQLTVVTYTKEIDLADIQIKVSKDAYFAFNEEATLSSIEASAGQYVRLETTRGAFLKPGDTLEFCLDGPTSGSASVSILVASPDAQVYENSFTGLQAC